MEKSGSFAGFRRVAVFASAVLFSAFLGGCGGGGGGGGGNPPVVTSWTKQMGVAGEYTGASSVATDTSGNIFVAGSTTGGLDGNTPIGMGGLFLTKYDASGSKLFTKLMGVALSEIIISDIATDTSGNVYLAGSTAVGLDGKLKSGFVDFFLMKYDASGTWVYTNLMGASGAYTQANGVAVDSSGNIYVAGHTDGALGTNTKTGNYDFFLAKYDSNGDLLYVTQMGVSGKDTQAYGVATYATDNVYVAGNTDGGLDGEAPIGSRDAFLTKFSSDGNTHTTYLVGTASAYTGAKGVATDTSGNVFIAGYTNGGLDGSPTGSFDLFLTKYNADGTWAHTKQLGAPGAVVSVTGVATDTVGNVNVTGYINGGLDDSALTGSMDFFLTKYDSSGNRLYTKQMGATGADTLARDVATDASGNAYVAGETSGGLDGNTLTGTSDFFVVKYNSAGTKQ